MLWPLRTCFCVFCSLNKTFMFSVHHHGIGWGLVFRRARNFYHLIDSAVTTNFYCFNVSLKWPLLPTANLTPSA